MLPMDLTRVIVSFLNDCAESLLLVHFSNQDSHHCALDSHDNFFRGRRELICMIKRVPKKTTSWTNAPCTADTVWHSRVLARPAASHFQDDANTGTVTSSRTVNTRNVLFDQELYESILLAFDQGEEGGPPQSSVLPMAALGTNNFKDDKMSRKQSVDLSPYIVQRCSESNFLSSSPKRHTHKEYPSPILSLDAEPMEDWLSCLEKMFAAPCSPPWKPPGPSNLSFHVHMIKAQDNYTSCSNEAWPQLWDLLEPRPLPMMDSQSNEWQG